MYRYILSLIILCLLTVEAGATAPMPLSGQLSGLRYDQEISGFRVSNLYSDSGGKIVGAKFYHIRSTAPVFLLQMETVPKAFIWVDTPDWSDRGVPHALEHLLSDKGTQGRYMTLLTNMQLSYRTAGTLQDYNFYAFSSGSGIEGFFEQLHAWFENLFHSDFTAPEAERELYHVGISFDAAKNRTLVEQGSVYQERLSGQGTETYYFELNKRLLGDRNPFAFDIRGFPDTMQSVTAQEIRTFYEKNYRLGPTMGFIFIIDPKEDVDAFLRRVAQDFDEFSHSTAVQPHANDPGQPNYPIHPSENRAIEIYPFPSGSETDAADIRFGWKPIKTDSPSELKLLQLLFRGLAGSQRSLLYKLLVDSKSRVLDSGARGVDHDVFLYNSSFFPFEQIEISKIPGNRITVVQIEQLRNVVQNAIRQVSEYQDGSQDLASFNALIASNAKTWRRTDGVWTRTPPRFGTDLNSEWKDYLNLLEMDGSFVRPLSQDAVWQAVERQLSSGKNIWRDLIVKFHLLDEPYATASKPSPQLLESIETAKQDRIRKRTEALRQQYHANSDQEALARFEQDELVKTKEIDKIEAAVPHPRFTDHPPLTADDEIRYRQFRLAGVPVVASIFERPPTIDIGLVFDLRQIPRKYYRYIPILPRCFDSLGLRDDKQVVSYQELIAKIQEKTVKFSVGYESNPVSKRGDLVFRASAINGAEFREALKLLRQILYSSDLSTASLEHLQDLVVQRLAAYDAFQANEFSLMQNAAFSFWTQQDPLFAAIYSLFPRSHWDGRLKWLLHKTVSSEEIERLGSFSEQILSHQSDISSQEITRQLGRSDLNDLDRELLQYWERNISSFPETELTAGLRQLTLEVQEDLRTGPIQALNDLKELQRILLNRQLLRLDLMLDEATLNEIKPDLTAFLESIPQVEIHVPASGAPDMPIMKKVEKRYRLSHQEFPWYVGLVNRNSLAGDMVFYSDLPGYSQLDHASLIKILATKVFADAGPESFNMKTRDMGLAYEIQLTSNPAYKLLWDYGDRVPDIPGLVRLLDSVAHKAEDLKDPLLVDYALRQTFSTPRSIFPPSERAIAMSQDIRDGNGPETVRRFSQAILKLRQAPGLLTELTHATFDSLCGILMDEKCKKQQTAAHSIFFFVGSAKILSDTEKRLPIPKLLRVWPSDYWIP